ncbi:MAG: N-acetylneuraminate synthase [Alphaproteobacteria bacterium]|nr:N-acetylneuraminate synthase [Alphaproteobacteria bacterium]
MTAPLVIAEAGVNHNGSLARAKKMVRVAASAGADYVKFQAFRAEALVSHRAATAAYQKKNAGVRNQLSLLRKLELSLSDFATLAKECRRARIGFLVTPFDTAMAAPLIAMGMDRIKIPSGELTNEPMLRELARFRLPVILSTGMATKAEVGRALAVLRRAGAKDVTLLHCTSLYPAPVSAINLRAIETMRRAFDVDVGYSDHSMGDHVSVAAVALGAVAIEKHFTLDRTLPGPDHKASLEPAELKDMIVRLRETAAALGDGIKRPARGETAVAHLVRRSWHARRDLSAGTTLAKDDLVLKRPADGLSPSNAPFGRRLKRARRADTAIRSGDLV